MKLTTWKLLQHTKISTYMLAAISRQMTALQISPYIYQIKTLWRIRPNKTIDTSQQSMKKHSNRSKQLTIPALDESNWRSETRRSSAALRTTCFDSLSPNFLAISDKSISRKKERKERVCFLRLLLWMAEDDIDEQPWREYQIWCVSSFRLAPLRKNRRCHFAFLSGVFPPIQIISFFLYFPPN